MFKHRHKFDESGNQLCCTQEEKINIRVDTELEIPQNDINCCDANPEIGHTQNHNHEI